MLRAHHRVIRFSLMRPVLSCRSSLPAPPYRAPRPCHVPCPSHVPLVRGGAYFFFLVSYRLYYRFLRCPARHYRVACLVWPLPHLSVSRVPRPLHQDPLPAAERLRVPSLPLLVLPAAVASLVPCRRAAPARAAVSFPYRLAASVLLLALRLPPPLVPLCSLRRLRLRLHPVYCRSAALALERVPVHPRPPVRAPLRLSAQPFHPVSSGPVFLIPVRRPRVPRLH